MNKYENFIGKVLDGRYKILELVGVGGMAFVLKAEDLLMNRVVAIKILNDQYNGDEQAELRFINESKAVAMLSHKNVVSVFDVNIYPDMKYIVMEYLDGITLKEYLDKKGAIPWKEACLYIEQVLHALEHAHGKGVIHRDIKPQNIILLKNGEIKVTDFGIAKLPNSPSMTITEKAIGTVYYISPEQASGTETSYSSDIYSVGVMMYEALTGQLPFTADSPVAIALMQINDAPVNPVEINPEIPNGAAQIVLKAMQKESEMRFSTAHNMVKAIQYLFRYPEVEFTDNVIASENSTDKNFVNINQIETGEFDEIKNDSSADKKKDKKKKKKFEQYRSRSFFPIISGIFVSFVIVAVGVAAYLIFTFLSDLINPPPVNSTFIVSDFVGKIYDNELESTMTKNKYYVTVREAIKTNEPNNKILSQTPSADSVLRDIEGGYCRIEIVVNKISTEVTVPDIKYLTLAEAKKQLDDLDIEWRAEAQQSEIFNENQVIGSNLEPGETIATNETLTIYYSIGMSSLKAGEMIDVIDMSYSQAKRRLEDLFYTVIENKINSNKPNGTVIGQSINAGTGELDAGTQVILDVSIYVQGKPVMPYLIGKSENDALAELVDLGISLTSDIVYEPSSHLAGTVIAQSVPLGTEIDDKTVITFTVSSGHGGD